MVGHLRSVTDLVADSLLEAYTRPAAEGEHIGSYELPSTTDIANLVEECRALLFPGYAGPTVGRMSPSELRDLVRERLDRLRSGLRRQVFRGLHHKRQQRQGTAEMDCPECSHQAEHIADRFIEQLPALRKAALRDVHAAFESDPAATGLDEILFCYPGTYAISVYRIAHALLQLGAELIPRIMTELAKRRTGIDIHPGAEIGEAFFIDHGTGVVIGQTARIGDRVRLYQGVTLGALSIPQGQERPAAGQRRHPTIEDDVVIYANATILGGDTVIGKGAVVGGNSWVTASVPAGGRVSGSATRTRPTEA
ncbi:MAG: serine O-acetyltransferase EpsC [Kofleriaceae bacterium]